MIAVGDFYTPVKMIKGDTLNVYYAFSVDNLPSTE